MLGGIVCVSRNGLRRCDAPKDDDPHETLDDLPKARSLLGDRDYDADGRGDALEA